MRGLEEARVCLQFVTKGTFRVRSGVGVKHLERIMTFLMAIVAPFLFDCLQVAVTDYPELVYLKEAWG